MTWKWVESRPAESTTEALLMMLIRNECRAGFSNVVNEIEWDQQLAWWKETEGKRLAWLYTNNIEVLPFGFGLLLLQPDGLWTTTVAVLWDHSGLGYGKEITHDIVTRCPGECRATARKDNPAAVKCHDLVRDWDEVDGPDERLVYFMTKAAHRLAVESGSEKKFWGVSTW